MEKKNNYLDAIGVFHLLAKKKLTIFSHLHKIMTQSQPGEESPKPSGTTMR